MRIVNLHDAGVRNTGDLWAAVGRHAPALGLGGYSWRFFQQSEAQDAGRFGDAIVLGGGGVCAPYYPWLKALSEIPEDRLKDCVAWGIGTNYHDVRRHLRGRAPEIARAGLKYPDWVKRITDGGGLVGVRDAGAPYPWVPCASCMLPQLEALRAKDPTRDVVGYEHFEYPLRVPVHTLQSIVPLAVALEHLASAETILTNSYHGAYWGTLLGRKVVVVDAFSSRFRFMKHPPAFADSPADWEAAEARAVTYPAALEECRLANLSFASTVRAKFRI